jgi:hypothetical protein
MEEHAPTKQLIYRVLFRSIVRIEIAGSDDHAGTASTILTGEFVGMTQVSLKPAFPTGRGTRARFVPALGSGRACVDVDRDKLAESGRGFPIP